MSVIIVIAAVAILAFITACRIDVSIADFYAGQLYPGISSALSFIASAVPVSLEEITVVIFAVLAVYLLAKAIRGKEGWKRHLCQLVLLIIICYDWAYFAWGINYFRSSIYDRAKAIPVKVDNDEFASFLDNYTRELNDSYVSTVAIDTVRLEQETKAYYSAHGKALGLCKPRAWQHPKKLIFNRLYSAVGVLGYIGTNFVESHLNKDLLPLQYPYTYAHEYAHVLGVSNEAEANWWAYMVCKESSDPAVRYSAYYSLLPHVWINARNILGKEEFAQWTRTIRPETLASLSEEEKFWDGKRIPLLDKLQSFVYDLFLKGNKISEGIKNYSSVIRMIMTLDSPQVTAKGTTV